MEDMVALMEVLTEAPMAGDTEDTAEDTGVTAGGCIVDTEAA